MEAYWTFCLVVVVAGGAFAINDKLSRIACALETLARR